MRDDTSQKGRKMDMFDKREINVEVFEDTQKMILENSTLQEAVSNSIRKQKLFPEAEEHNFVANKKREKPAELVVSKKRTLEAASFHARAGKKVCVLNFASATNPGGGVANGASTQEECLCRCSTLYPCLNIRKMWNEFYRPHRASHNVLYNDDCIYTPEIYVVKSDVSVPERMKAADWYKVDVLSCAAPNLRMQSDTRYNPNGGRAVTRLTREKLRTLLYSRIKRIFQVSMTNGADVLILGAFGCGAFQNPPRLVAEVFRDLTSEYQNYFDTIEYAVFCRSNEMENYDAFCRVFRTK